MVGWDFTSSPNKMSSSSSFEHSLWNYNFSSEMVAHAMISWSSTLLHTRQNPHQNVSEPQKYLRTTRPVSSSCQLSILKINKSSRNLSKKQLFDVTFKEGFSLVCKFTKKCFCSVVFLGIFLRITQRSRNSCQCVTS